MTFVTRLTLESGDRVVLDEVVKEIKSRAERKGAQLKGPHSPPPERSNVPQLRTLHDPDGLTFSSWEYTVFTREIEIHGHESFARSVAGRDFPDSIYVEVEIEHVRGVGRT